MEKMMPLHDLAGRMDLTMLRPDAAISEVEKFIEGALAFPFKTLCIPPFHVPLAVKALEGSPTEASTVIGFPLGFQAPGVKLYEARKAFDEGAKELDIVMNISAFRSGDTAYVIGEIGEVVKNLPGAVVKVIIEACYLSDEEKVRACEAAVASGASFVKTSTGFAPGGATAGDVRLLRDSAAGRIKIKAAGGIRDPGTAMAMIEAGADRIGTSSGVEILKALSKGAG